MVKKYFSHIFNNYIKKPSSQFFKEKKDKIKILAFTEFIALIMFMFNTGCPFVLFFGIPCMGCGMTRACIALLRFDFVAAFKFHPLVYLLPLFFILFLWWEDVKHKRLILIIIALLFIIAYIYRAHYTGGNFIVANIKDGIIYKFFNYIF